MTGAAVGFAAKGIASYAGQIASFLGKSAKLIGQSFGHSATGAVSQIITNRSGADIFLGSRGWAGLAVAAAVSIPTAVMNLTNFFDDSRRLKEIASGQSNFYTSREAATKSFGLSTLGLASSATLGISGALMGAATGSPLGLACTIGSGLIATGSLIARNLYKWSTIDLPFHANTGLGILSMGKPVFRVDDPSSPYYMMSHMMEKTVRNRELQDKQGEMGAGYLKKVENFGLGFANYLMA